MFYTDYNAYIYVVIFYFVISELFYSYIITLLCILRTEVSSQLFYSLSVVLLAATNSLYKATRLLFIFVRESTGHIPFQLKGIGYSW